jgi:hypothetical protein
MLKFFRDVNVNIKIFLTMKPPKFTKISEKHRVSILKVDLNVTDKLAFHKKFKTHILSIKFPFSQQVLPPKCILPMKTTMFP